MKLTIILILTSLISLHANADDEITPNHQVNPPHTFKQVVCVESENSGKSGYTILVDIPNGRNAEAKVYFKRVGAPLSLVASWEVKYIIDPGVYVSIANQFQKMDISRGSEDLFHLNFQLHSGNGQNGIYSSIFESPSLLGFTARNSYERRLNRKELDCRFVEEQTENPPIKCKGMRFPDQDSNGNWYCRNGGNH